MKEQLQIKKIPQTTEEAVRVLIVEGDEKRVIEYLKNHPDDVNEFCLQTVEAYNSGDNTGVVRLGFIIKELLTKQPKTKIERNADDFKNFIEIGKEITKSEALEKLSTFHNVGHQNILDAFLNLRNINEPDDIVIFENSVNGSSPCISMRIYSKDRKFISSSLINKTTGQPMEHVS